MYRSIVNFLIMFLLFIPSTSIAAQDRSVDYSKLPPMYECRIPKGQIFTIIDDDAITYYVTSFECTHIASREGNRVKFSADKVGSIFFLVQEADKPYYVWCIDVYDEPGYMDKELVINGDQFIWQEKVYNEADTANNPNYAHDVLELVNIERRKEGVEPLKLSDELMEAANIRAEEITRVYSHTRPNGESCRTVIKAKNCTFGENIAAGCVTPAEVVQVWMNSSGHRANILRPEFKKLGVGYAQKEDAVYKRYWVQVFQD